MRRLPEPTRTMARAAGSNVRSPYLESAHPPYFPDAPAFRVRVVVGHAWHTVFQAVLTNHPLQSLFRRSKLTARPDFPVFSPRCSSLVVTALLLFALSGISASIRAAAQSASNPTADEITFINGDKLTGAVVGEKGGVVVFQSDMTGRSEEHTSELQSL